MDALAWYGGEEFAVVLPAPPGRRLYRRWPERIRRSVAATPVRIDTHTELNITISVAAPVPCNGSDRSTALDRSGRPPALLATQAEGRKPCVHRRAARARVTRRERAAFRPLYTPLGWGDLSSMNFNAAPALKAKR